MRSPQRALGAVLAITILGTVLPGCTAQAEDPGSSSAATLNANEITTLTPTETAIRRAQAGKAAPPATTARSKPLRRITIALDPGHQLGNHNFPRQTSALVPAGGFHKPCNTTGTATNSGVAEATVTMRLARSVTRRLRTLGARVRLTRRTISQRRWGPCVDTRGRFGKRVGARLMVSLHADGAASSGRGFHVIAPTRRSPWTTDIATASRRLAKRLRDGLTHAGVRRSNYVGGGTGLDVRSDLGTLNMSDVPVAMIEIGNMRNASDARQMTSRSGRGRYARAVVRGIRAYLHR